MADDPRHKLGRTGEDAAVTHLERLGLEILARNHRTRFGELDVIAYDGESLIFCEVKSRRAGPMRPFDAVGEAKQAQVKRMAAAWLAETPVRPRSKEVRFDAIGVTFDAGGRLLALDHLEGAF
jgi:putative endonuclease